MKKWILLFALFNTTLLVSSLAQTSQIVPLEKGIYLVVGSFQNKVNAVKFRDKLSTQGNEIY